MRGSAVVLTVAVVMAPLGAQGADLVVWWEKGFYPQADEAVREIVAAFEQETGKEIELVQPAQDEVFDNAQAALAATQPPDFLFGTTSESWAAKWAYEDKLVDLAETLRPVLDLFDIDLLEASTMLNCKTGRRGLYALPMGRGSNHIHVWNSLLERAGFTLADLPKEWSAFWSFWCDQVQPAAREAIGRDDVWGVGLPCRRRRSPTPLTNSSSSSLPWTHPGWASTAGFRWTTPRFGKGWSRRWTPIPPSGAKGVPRPTR